MRTTGKGSDLEKSDSFNKDLALMIKKTYREHKRIVFNGNNYSAEWVAEAHRRGLSNLKTAVDALPQFISQKSIDLFKKQGVFSESEIYSRYEILMDSYCKTIHIEALTMLDMVKGEIIPACVEYQNNLARLIERKRVGEYDISMEDYLLDNISKLTGYLLGKLRILEGTGILDSTKSERNISEQAEFYRNEVFTAMSELRVVADELETLVGRKYWTLPGYGELLYSVI